MSLPFLVLVVILLIYTALIKLLLIGWRRITEFRPQTLTEEIFVSVLVPFRDEEKHITNLLDDLTHQNYPSQQFEIIVVDDHSVDKSSELVQNYSIDVNHNIILHHLPGDLSGKKEALRYGTGYCSGKVILTTDADCRVPVDWIRTFITYYNAMEEPGLITGLVDHNKITGFFQWLQNLEYLSLIGSGAGAAGIHKPVYCNGANMMFRKDVYFEIEDPLVINTPSGDDTFLLHHIKKKYPDKIFALKSHDSLVLTQPAATIRDFINQRIRWASKVRYYFDPHILILSAVILISNLAIFICLVLFVSKHNGLFLLPLLYKMLIDWIFMIPVLSWFEKKRLHILVPLLSLIYPVYILLSVPATIFGHYKWRGRSYR